MNHLFFHLRLLVWMFIISGGIIVQAESNEFSSNPLAYLNKKQRTHYDLYDKLNVLKASNESFDRNIIYGNLYSVVNEWCVAAAPKYKYESMKAGDKAKDSKNERMKKELTEKSVLYSDIYQICEKIKKAYQDKVYLGIASLVQKFSNLERECRVKGYQYLKRDWLTYSEYEVLYFQVQAAVHQSNQGKREGKNVPNKHNFDTKKFGNRQKEPLRKQ